MTDGPLVPDLRLHPLSATIVWLRHLPQNVIGLPAILAVTSSMSWGTVLLLALSLGLFNLVAAYSRWWRFRYAIGNDEIVIESGLISKNRRVIPLTRVQDVEIEQALLHRLFGLAKVRLETGSGGKDEGLLDSLSLNEAQRLRALLKREARPSAVTEKSETSVPLFRMPLARILRMGALSFSFASIAAAMGSGFVLLTQFDQTLGEPERLWGLAWRYGALVVERGWLLPAILVFLALAAVFSMGGAVVRDFGYSLEKEERGFRRKRGLLTRSDVLIPISRVQAGLVTNGPVWDRLGWHHLSLQTMGGGDGAGGHQAAAPFARIEEVAGILEQIPPLALLPDKPLNPVSSRHVPARLLGSCGWLIVAILLAGAFWPAVFLAAILVPIVALATWADARRHGWRTEMGLVWVRSGFWTRKLWIIPITKIQSLAVEQGPIQRRFGLASLVIDTAGASLLGGGHIQNLTLDGARALCSELAQETWQKRPIG